MVQDRVILIAIAALMVTALGVDITSAVEGGLQLAVFIICVILLIEFVVVRLKLGQWCKRRQSKRTKYIDAHARTQQGPRPPVRDFSARGPRPPIREHRDRIH